MRRIACIRIPHPELAHCLQGHPDWFGCPVIVLDGEGPKATVRDVSRAAKEAGVAPGMTTAQAHAILPSVYSLTHLPVEMQREWERVAVLLGRFSPIVECSDEPGVFYLDGHGMGRIYPTEREYISHIRFSLQGEGYQSRVAIAGSRFSARAATQLGDIETLAPRHEASALAALPVSVLPLSAALSEAFHTLGVRTLGQVAALPVEQLEARFGKEGVFTARLARGEDPTPLKPYRPAALIAVDIELDGPVEGLEPARFILKTITDRLIGALAERGLACEESRLHLRLDNRTTAVLGVVPAAPTLSAPLLWELARTRLEREALPAPIVHVRMEAVRVRPAEPTQQALFLRNGNQERAQLAIARLRGILGDEAVLVPRRSAAYRPERRITWLAYQESAPNRKKKATARPRRRRGFYKPKDSDCALLPFPSLSEQPQTADRAGCRAHGSGAT